MRRVRNAPPRRALPNDLLSRSEEEAARRLALKALSAARSAELRLDDRYDREALHDFRVAVRRLRSVLRAYKVQLQDAVRGKDRRKLRTIQRATGAGREAEVALKWLTKQQASLEPEHLAGLNWLSGTLLDRRRRCSEDLDAEVRASFRQTTAELEERLAIMRTEHNLLAERPEHTFATCAADLTEAHANDLMSILGQMATLEDNVRLHDGRIAGKRLRYLLEPLRPYMNEAQKVVKRTKQLQDVLGDLNDVHVLMNEIDVSLRDSMRQRSNRIRASLQAGDVVRAKREASMSEWAGLVELHSRLTDERRSLIAKLRDQWLAADLESLVTHARDLADRLRLLDRSN